MTKKRHDKNCKIYTSDAKKKFAAQYGDNRNKLAIKHARKNTFGIFYIALALITRAVSDGGTIGEEGNTTEWVVRSFDVTRICSRHAHYTLCIEKNDTDVAHYNFNEYQPILIILAKLWLLNSVIFVNENENENAKTAKLVTQRKC